MMRRERWERPARFALMLILDLLGVALIVYAACLVSVALGCLVAGLIALGVAVVVTPATRQAEERQDDEEGAPEA